MTADLHLRLLGAVPYRECWDLQRELHAERVADAIGDTLLVLTHPPVITAGRAEGRPNVWTNLRARPATLKSMGIDLVETDRGGDLTFHGPGQIVAYPIVKLAEGERDIGRFVAKLEEVQRLFLAELGVRATRDPDHRGMWVGANKIGAIGARVRSWTTMHGIAINIDGPQDGFSWIVPCGIADRGVTSVAEERPELLLPPRRELERRVAETFAAVFERNLVVP